MDNASTARIDDGRSGRRAGGFTIVEAAIALAIVGVLLAAGVPVYADWIAAYQLRNYAEQLAGSLAYARSEAVARATRVTLCPAAGARCNATGQWGTGWIVYVDDDGDGTASDAEALLRTERVAVPDIRVSANRPIESYVSFNALGHARLVNGGLQMGTFVACRRGQRAIKVVLANSGRVRLDKTTDVCS
jgi:type IV fimbrial biogenesis protein FimT